MVASNKYSFAVAGSCRMRVSIGRGVGSRNDDSGGVTR